jgi:hypothetical protein
MKNVTFKEIAEAYLVEEIQRKHTYFWIKINDLKAIIAIQDRLISLIQKQTFCPLYYEESQEMERLEKELECIRRKKGK